jgi:aromatic-L-amino-acid/L-tryptophan decarboxylase
MQKETTLDPREWESVRALGHRMVDDMLAHVRDVRERPAWQPMPQSARDALAADVPLSPGDLETIYADFLEHVLPYGLGNIHPRFWGWVIGTGTFSAALADFLAVAMNTNVAGFDTSIVALEEQVLRWLREMLRLPEGRSGLLMSGGSEANFHGIAAGVRAVLGVEYAKGGLVAMKERPVVYTSAATHFSVKRAVRVLGLGEASYRVIPCDDAHRIDVGALRAAIARDRVAGMRPCMIAANAGTVGIGGFDPLGELADIAVHEGLWLHVDGAFGAMVALTDRYAHLVEGMERADSVTLDLHKWMHTPIEAACVFIRDDEAHHAAFAVQGAYLSNMREGPAKRINRFTDMGLQQSRSARAIKIWFSLREHGRKRFADCVEMNIEQAAWLAREIEAMPNAELFAPVASNIVCFRLTPDAIREERWNAFNQEVLTRIQARGLATPSSFVSNDRFALRCCIANHRTTYADLEFFLGVLGSVADEVLAEEGSLVHR